MSILEGVKASNCKIDKPKFVIKARSNSSNKEINKDDLWEANSATDAEVLQFIDYMVTKSNRLH